MPLPHDNTPSEKHIRSRLKTLDLNNDATTCIEEAVVEESNDPVAMGGKRGSKRGPYLCTKVCRSHMDIQFYNYSRADGFLITFKYRLGVLSNSRSSIPVKCRQPRKGHVCPYATKKQNPRYEKREKETKDTQIQTIEGKFSY